MKNNDLIKDFIKGAVKGKGSNLFIDGDKLINYTTCIAIRRRGKIYLNAKKYSPTTSVHQNRIRRETNEVFELGEEVFNNMLRGH